MNGCITGAVATTLAAPSIGRVQSCVLGRPSRAVDSSRPVLSAMRSSRVPSPAATRSLGASGQRCRQDLSYRQGELHLPLSDRIASHRRPRGARTHNPGPSQVPHGGRFCRGCRPTRYSNRLGCSGRVGEHSSPDSSARDLPTVDRFHAMPARLGALIRLNVWLEFVTVGARRPSDRVVVAHLVAQS